jgi:hypothetical protein
MVALTFDHAGAAGIDTAPQEAAKTAAVVAPRKAWYARLFDAMIEARMQQARREINLYTLRLPYTIDKNGNRVPKSDVNAPLGGW